MLRHSQLHVPEKGKPTQKKRQNAGSPYLFYGLIEGISRFKGKDYKEERKGGGRGGGGGTQFNMGKGYRLIDMYIYNYFLTTVITEKIFSQKHRKNYKISTYKTYIKLGKLTLR